MAKRHFCNGCGQQKAPAELRKVRFSANSIPGPEQPIPESKTDTHVVGELCAPCVGVVGQFVGDTPDEDAAEVISAPLAVAR